METKGNSALDKEQFGNVVPVAENVDLAQQIVEENDTLDTQIDDHSEFELTDQEQEDVDHKDQLEMEAKSKAQIVEILAQLIQERPAHTLKQVVEQLKVAFYKKHNAEVEDLKTEFEKANPDHEFTSPEDKIEARFKELINLYRTKRDQFIATAEAEKERNYKQKLQIIEELKELISSSETLNNTFNTFRELQKRWKDIGVVPQNLVRDLWDTYNYHIESFYNYIKINKELRDLDLKKNLEAKTDLCQEAEALMLEASPVNAFHKLQKLHSQWREIGPVATEYKEQIWDRFKQASSHVNKRHQEYFDALKEEQLANLNLKEELCVNVENIAANKYDTRAEWDEASNKIIEIQKVWKTIGFAPRKDNNRIYDRFRAACDRFFTAKREFFETVKNELADNYQAKMDLCVQAEALADSNDWKKTTDEIIELQKRWKNIGPTSRKYSEAVWKRFRSACDKFFDNKAKHFDNEDSQYAQNLVDKQAIIDELKNLDLKSVTFEILKSVQQRWSAIGYVPIKVKDAIQKQYKELTDKIYETLRSAEGSRRVENFKGRLANLKETGRVHSERDKMIAKMRALEAEIATLENNIGFFGNSKNAAALVKDVQNKIDKAKTEIAEIIQKIKIIDNQSE